MDLLKIVLKNFKNYGFFNIFLIIFFETIYSFNKVYRRQIFHDETITDTYEDIDINNKTIKFDGPYHPTPIYILILIRNQIKKINLKNFIFIDFGCGVGRSIYFFKKFFEKKISIDINENYKKFFTKDLFLKKNIKEIKKSEEITSNTLEKSFVLYFYRPIEDESVKKIIKMFMNKRIIVITINVKKMNIEKLKTFYEKYFPDKNRNIIIYSNFLD